MATLTNPGDSEVLEMTDDALIESDSVGNDSGEMDSGERGSPAITVVEPQAKSPLKTPAKTSLKAKPVAKRSPAARDKTNGKPVAGKSATEKQAPTKGRSPSKKAEATAEDGDETPLPRATFAEWFRHHWNESSGLMASVIVHMLLIILLCLLTLPLPFVPDLSLVSAPGEKVDDLTEIPELDMEDPVEPIDPSEIVEQPDTTNITEDISFSPFSDTTAAAAAMELADFGLNSAPESLTTSVTGFDGSGLTGRGQASRNALVRMNGGSEASEEAVANALAWLVQHQNPDGTWSLDHTGGECQGRCKNPGELRNSLISGTALGVLPFLGAGQTHKEGKYKEQVGKAIDALVRLGKPTPNGVSWMDGGNLYAHGIASIAICEAYAMSDDYRLMEPSQAAINFIVYAQDPSGGGWRYTPRQAGDTSVVGWQVMALKSGYMGQLNVPNTTITAAGKFLDSVATDYGEGYAYVPENKRYKASTSAVGLLCRMYMGTKKDNDVLAAGVTRLAKLGPSKTDYYSNYYANQVIFQFTGGKGAMWKAWNEKLRDQLVVTQGKEGHEKGSWYVRSTHASQSGGRLYMTAMATMTLEVYYRHMPIYQAESVDMEFPE